VAIWAMAHHKNLIAFYDWYIHTKNLCTFVHRLQDEVEKSQTFRKLSFHAKKHFCKNGRFLWGRRGGERNKYKQM
jgi:hypothetical protein